jgi:hypothetical protein
MNDRQLLEAAAKAAGMEVLHMALSGFNIMSGPFAGMLWNPLISDADAFRLAVKLRISIWFEGGGKEDGGQTWVVAECRGCGMNEFIEQNADHQHDPASTRRAIVRAAASLKDWK